MRQQQGKHQPKANPFLPLEEFEISDFVSSLTSESAAAVMVPREIRRHECPLEEKTVNTRVAFRRAAPVYDYERT